MPTGDLFGHALHSFQQGDLAAALKTGLQLIQQGVSQPQLFELVGICAYQLGDLPQAVRAFDRQVRIEPDDINARNNLAQVLTESAAYEQALTIVQETLKLDPVNATASNCLGNIYRALHQPDKAKLAYQQAIQQGAKTALTYCNLGSVVQELYAYDEAEAYYNNALQIDPAFAPARYNLALLYQLTNQMQKAGQIYREITPLYQDDPAFLNNLTRFYRETGEYDKALEYADHILQANPDNIHAVLNKAKVLEVTGRRLEAETYYRQSLDKQPDSADANYAMGQYLLRCGITAGAIEYFSKALSIQADMLLALSGLAEAYLQRDEKKTALKFAKQAIEIAGHDMAANEVYGACLLNNGLMEQAFKFINKLSKKYPTQAEPSLLTARYYDAVGQYDESARHYSQAVSLLSDPVNAWLEWAGMEEKRNNLAAVRELLVKLQAHNQNNNHIVILQARLAFREDKLQAALDYLDMLDSRQLEKDKKNHFMSLYLRGDVLQKLKQYDKAYQAYLQGSQIKNSVYGDSYDSEAMEQKVRDLRTVFVRERIEAMPVPEQGIPMLPVFIVGFPRSGTSLIEQILSSHPEVVAGGELPLIAELAAGRCEGLFDGTVGFPACLNNDKAIMSADMIHKARAYYFTRIKQYMPLGGHGRYITDKLPQNVINLGLISLLFPEAPIIHVIRHPLDSCFSAFAANFAHGHRYTSSIEKTFKYYVTSMQLLKHYNAELNMKYLEIRYEDLITGQEQKTRELLKFIGLPWDEHCLRFYENKRVVKTASYEQVTRKIYTSARYRYKHYLKDLQPFLPLIEDTIHELGYRVEQGE